MSSEKEMKVKGENKIPNYGVRKTLVKEEREESETNEIRKANHYQRQELRKPLI